MKLQGEYSFQDFIDLCFNKYYFNSKQNLGNRILLMLTAGALSVELVLFLFFRTYFEKINSYIDPNFIVFLFFVLIMLYFFKPKLIYEKYKKNHKPDSYMELTEKEFKVCNNKVLKFDMKKLRNTVVLKNGYFLDFDETFIIYIPHRFFRNSEELRFFHDICYKNKAT